jgi:hypothetical protein
MTDRDSSFLQHLLNKQAMVQKTENETGKNLGSAKDEVNRQIKQAMEGKDPIKGKGVTKSGGDDGF